MFVALGQARAAARAGDAPVGAVVASQNGRLLARAANRVERDADPVGHAEIIALRKAAAAIASPRLGGCVLVVTLEPCVMCLGAAAHARVDGVVYGARDPRAGAVDSACDPGDIPLAGPRFWHMGGIMAEQCATLLREFFARRR